MIIFLHAARIPLFTDLQFAYIIILIYQTYAYMYQFVHHAPFTLGVLIMREFINVVMFCPDTRLPN